MGNGIPDSLSSREGFCLCWSVWSLRELLSLSQLWRWGPQLSPSVLALLGKMTSATVKLPWRCLPAPLRLYLLPALWNLQGLPTVKGFHPTLGWAQRKWTAGVALETPLGLALDISSFYALT